jgi:signal transduction histidine kinase/CheY-like chemotaxis protein
MKKFRDINTGTQLWISFSLLIVFLVTISLIAWIQTDKMVGQIEKMYNHPLQVRRALGKFEVSVTAIHRDMRGLMHTDSEEETEDLLNEIELNKAEAFRQLDILQEKHLGSNVDITNLRNEFTKWNLIREETIRKLRQGNLTEAIARTKRKGVGGAQALSLYQHTTKVDETSRRIADDFYTNTIHLRRELNNRLLAIILTAFIFSVLIVIFLSRLINNPLKEITLAIQSYRSGNKSSRSAYLSGNLLGKLSESFNEMAETIEAENEIAHKATELSNIMLSVNDVKGFCADLLSSLLDHTNSQMGAVYLLNENQTHFERYSCLGMDAEGCKPFSAIHPEGEFGLALTFQKICHVKDIPADSRFSFHTVTGRFKPREIITIPVINDGQTVAIISLISLHIYSEISIRLIESIFSTLTARMNGILAYKKMIDLYEKLEEQNVELDTQKNELGAMTDELKQQNTELEIQKNQLGEINRLKSNFLSNMSHELRTPLNSVIALSEVLNRRLAQKIDEVDYSYLGVIERNGKHLLDLINDILDLSRIESGKVEIVKNSFNINGLLNDVVTMIKPQAEQKNIKLTFSEEPENPLLESDYNKCFHIFQNIIGNAVKFTEKGTVKVSVTAHKGNAEVRISDTGIGISDSDIPHIFDEFRQADGSNSRKFGGTGLGLSIARKYAELLGCSISVTSEKGKGSVFIVIIPQKATYKYTESSNFEQEISDLTFQSLPKQKIEGRTIILVEDTEAMILQMCDILETEGYIVDVARNGLEALDLLEKRIPDAMILDIMMPGMDGIELLNNIRNKEKTAQLPVIALTAKILSEEELEKIKNNHIYQLIQKGKITRESLLKSVASMTRQSNEKENENNAKAPQVKVNISGKPKILAVEDNADNMLALKALLGNHFVFIEAGNGMEGVEKAKHHKPHLIFMDIAMPEMNGIEALKEIRKNEFLKQTPVVAITSSAMRGDKNYFLELGFNGYVSKPVNSDLLFDEINKWITIENQ